MKRITILIIMLTILLTGISSPASAGVTLPNVTVACDTAGNLVISWDNNYNEVVIYVEDSVTWYENSYFTAAGSETFTGPDTFYFDVILLPYEEGLAEGNVTCEPSEAPVEFYCFPDGRVNRNCGAPIAIYLAQTNDGWNIHVFEIIEATRGDLYAFIKAEEIDDEGVHIGDLYVIEWTDDTYVAFFPRTNGKVYWLWFSLSRDEPWLGEGDIEF